MLQFETNELPEAKNFGKRHFWRDPSIESDPGPWGIWTRTSGMPRLDTTRLGTDGKNRTRHEEPPVSHNTTEPTGQKPADTADTTRLTRL